MRFCRQRVGGLLRKLSVGAFVCASISVAMAQGLSNRPIRVLTPYAPGAPGDATLRLIAQKASESGGPQVLIETRAGGGGVIAAMATKQAAPDGHTVFLCDIGTFSVNPTLIPNLSYDPVADFKPITTLWLFPSVLAVPASLPANSVKELVELAKRTPGGLSYGSQGAGSGGHIRGEILAKTTGAPLQHVAYKGGAPATVDLVAGRIAFVMGAYAGFQTFVENRQLKILGVSAKQRLAQLPDIPTLGEMGYPDVDLESWFGLAAPARTPDSIIQELNALFVRAAQSPEVKGKLDAMGIPVATSTPAALAALIKSDITRLQPVVKGMAGAN
jgi:tripartite-type tricarboxylate transporter receptor subunit TctC